MPEQTDEERRQQITDYLSHPILFPPDFKNWISDYVGLQIPKISVTQIMGFELWQIKSADPVEASVSVTSTSYVSAGGPTLSNLSPGFYIVIWGGHTPYTGAAGDEYIGLSINGAAVGNEVAQTTGGGFGAAALLDLTAVTPPISIECKYKRGGTSGKLVTERWLHALRVVTDG